MNEGSSGKNQHHTSRHKKPQTGPPPISCSSPFDQIRLNPTKSDQKNILFYSPNLAIHRPSDFSHPASVFWFPPPTSVFDRGLRTVDKTWTLNYLEINKCQPMPAAAAGGIPTRNRHQPIPPNPTKSHQKKYIFYSPHPTINYPLSTPRASTPVAPSRTRLQKRCERSAAPHFPLSTINHQLSTRLPDFTPQQEMASLWQSLPSKKCKLPQNS
jgi:hypothetical protein